MDYNDPQAELWCEVEDMLVNSEGRLRGLPGLERPNSGGAAELKRLGYVGSGGTLTKKGAEKALELQRAAGWI